VLPLQWIGESQLCERQKWPQGIEFRDWDLLEDGIPDKLSTNHAVVILAPVVISLLHHRSYDDRAGAAFTPKFL
jgi:hypothetical protein